MTVTAKDIEEVLARGRALEARQQRRVLALLFAQDVDGCSARPSGRDTPTAAATVIETAAMYEAFIESGFVG